MFDDNRNTILAIALSLVILIAWQYFVAVPQMEEQERARDAQQQTSEQVAAPGRDGSVPSPGESSVPGPGGESAAPRPNVPGGATPGTGRTREQVIAEGERVRIDTPALGGSVALRGGRIDDVVLKGYHETVDPSSPPIVLLSPSGSPNPYYAEFGWVPTQGSGVEVPGSDTVWTAETDGPLTPSNPLTLSWDNGDGLRFERTYTVDEDYMFSVNQSVENSTAEAVTLHPYALISRHGTPEISGYFVLHEGLIGVLGESGLQEIDYDDLLDDGALEYRGTGGWLGITDKYWAATLVPDQDMAFTARMTASQPEGGKPRYQTDYLLGGQEIAPGASVSVGANLFSGAKVVDVIDGYEQSLGIKSYELLIDWGWFYFITKPLFHVIDYFFKLVGNFGVAILIVTVLVKIVFFPLANKSYVSMSRMKLVQPEMMKIRERYKDDRMRQQQAMMELYKKEKINPMAGCLPILLQIPVFFALYKVLFVTIEMRHAPFFGWIQDLAAPDPTTIFNLFGLIPWDPPHFLMLGIWPLIMGFTMFIQMRLNPPPPDPTQAMIFNWMPVVFTFLLATFPAGLVIYWAWNNFLSILQQYVIMRRQGVKVELWDNLKGLLTGKKADATKSSE